jgi:lysophospholipase L1-like esterase
MSANLTSAIRTAAGTALLAIFLVPVAAAPGDSFAASHGVKAEAPAVMPQPSPAVDPFAAQRPKTESAGVVVPPGEFKSPAVLQGYIADVTTFAGLPPMNGGGIAFVGDNLIEKGRWSDAYPDIDVRNFGIAGDTTLGLENRLAQIVKAKPAQVFLETGSNDIEYGRPLPEIVANYDHILAKLAAELPKARIVVMGLLPRQPQYADSVKALNAELKKLAAARKLIYLDLYPHFTADGARLDPLLTLDDVNLAGNGYLRWRDLIQDYVAADAGEKTPPRVPHRKRPTLPKKKVP